MPEISIIELKEKFYWLFAYHTQGGAQMLIAVDIKRKVTETHSQQKSIQASKTIDPVSDKPSVNFALKMLVSPCVI